jgi:hypothetical protein
MQRIRYRLNGSRCSARGTALPHLVAREQPRHAFRQHDERPNAMSGLLVGHSRAMPMPVRCRSDFAPITGFAEFHGLPDGSAPRGCYDPAVGRPENARFGANLLARIGACAAPSAPCRSSPP